MLKKILLIALPVVALSACEKPSAPAARFNEDGQLMRPDPTEWILVSSSASAIAPTDEGGEGMMSGGDMMAGGDKADDAKDKPKEGRMDIIRIDPQSWEHYKETNEFPNGTVIAMSFYSMDEKGMGANRYWAGHPGNMEVAVKDTGRFEDGWAYFRFEGDAVSADAFPKDKCFQCHNEKGAKDNVFTQLYEAFQK